MREITGREAIREAMSEEMRRDPNVFLMGEDIGVYGGAFGVTAGMVEEFGKRRVRDTPISELGIVSAAVGASMLGLRPIVELMFMDFLMLAADALGNQAAKVVGMYAGQASVPMVCRAPGGAAGAGAHHTQCLESWFVNIPGLIVVMPSTPYDLKGLLKTSIRSNNPVLFVEHKLGYNKSGEVPEEEYTIPFGVADIKRAGKDVTIVATSYEVYKALDAAKKLEAEGIDVEVIDPRTLVPLDKETIINSVKKTGRLVIVHEAYESCGIGAEISAMIASSDAIYYLDAPIQRVTSVGVTMPYSPVLEKAVLPSVERIIDAVKKVL